MATVELARTAVNDLDRLIKTHSLPSNTRERVKRSLKSLGTFPLIGPELPGRWSGFRFILGPWRWMVFVYVVLDKGERVVVLTVQDARSSKSATAAR